MNNRRISRTVVFKAYPGRAAKDARKITFEVEAVALTKFLAANTTGMRHRNVMYLGASIGFGRISAHSGRWTILEKRNKSDQITIAKLSINRLITKPTD